MEDKAKSGVNKKYDWDKLRKLYLEADPRPTIKDFAKQNNVPYKYLSVRSSHEEWVKNNREVKRKTLQASSTRAITEKLGDMAEINKIAREKLQELVKSPDIDVQKWSIPLALEYSQVKPAQRIETTEKKDKKQDKSLEEDLRQVLNIKVA